MGGQKISRPRNSLSVTRSGRCPLRRPVGNIIILICCECSRCSANYIPINYRTKISRRAGECRIIQRRIYSRPVRAGDVIERGQIPAWHGSRKFRRVEVRQAAAVERIKPLTDRIGGNQRAREIRRSARHRSHRKLRAVIRDARGRNADGGRDDAGELRGVEIRQTGAVAGERKCVDGSKVGN